MRALLLLSLLCIASGVSPAQYRLTRHLTGLSQPVDIQAPRDGSGRLFVVQANGLIRVAQNGALLSAPLLDIRTKTRGTGECGLLGLALPPGFPQKQYFYVNYTNPGCTQSVIARYRLTSENSADANSEEILLTLAQPFANHNGGQLQFGPDGFLYIGWGDGGSGGDPQNHGQRPDSLLGKMLRLDVEGPQRPYGIPPANPFVGRGPFRDEVWATGLRNPWRFSFDRATGDLWIADVGQNRAEEVNFQPAASTGGENYGWRLMEGLQCFNPSSGCDQRGLTLPVHEYTRAQGDVSITGGYVYRGQRLPGLSGAYLFGDYVSGRIWALRRTGTTNTADSFRAELLLRAQGIGLSTFGQDEQGEIYVAGLSDGVIYRLDGDTAPQVTSQAVLNAASFQPGLTPGSAATLFASGITSSTGIFAASALPLPLTLRDLSVSLNGERVPLYAVANVNGLEQVNFQVPFTLSPGQARLAVTFAGRSTAEVSVPVLAAQPGIFTAGGLAVAVRNQGNTLVTAGQPARRGEAIYFYATGLGPVSNPPAVGAASPSSPLSEALTRPVVTLGGIPCAVSFAGLAPGFAGIYQVNLTVPTGASSGQQDLVISSGSAASPAARLPVE